MTDECIMPFGKYTGQKLANVPGGYLLHIYAMQCCSDELKAYIDENRTLLENELRKQLKNRRWVRKT